MFKEDLEGDSKGDFSGEFKQYFVGDLLSCSGQLRSGPGLVQFTAQILFFRA